MPECAAEPPLPCTAAKPRSSLEARALCDLQSYHVLDTEPDQEFDDITVAATAVCGAPIGIVSLVDYANNRGFFKSTVGIDMRGLDYGTEEVDKEAIFCIQACLLSEKIGQDVLEVEDALEHPVFRRNPAVTGLGIRFYAGAVLRSKLGSPIGTLCVLDKTVRKLDETQRRQLRFLARSVEVALECHKGKKMKELRASGFLGPDGLNDDDDESSLDEASTTAAQKQREDEEELRSIMFPGGKPLELPLTEFEARCLRELKSYKILDTSTSDVAFDDITQAAATVCDCPVGVVSLIDYENRRGFFKSTYGCGESPDTYQVYEPTEYDKSAVFCVQACKFIQGEDIFEISDAFHHPVFCRAPAVKMGLVFYAAAIIRAHNGTPMGTLCVLDKTPRTLTEIQRRQLSMLAKSVVCAMDDHRRSVTSAEEEEKSSVESLLPPSVTAEEETPLAGLLESKRKPLSSVTEEETGANKDTGANKAAPAGAVPGAFTDVQLLACAAFLVLAMAVLLVAVLVENGPERLAAAVGRWLGATEGGASNLLLAARGGAAAGGSGGVGASIIIVE